MRKGIIDVIKKMMDKSPYEFEYLIRKNNNNGFWGIKIFTKGLDKTVHGDSLLKAIPLIGQVYGETLDVIVFKGDVTFS